MAKVLRFDEQFPSMTFNVVGGGTLCLPDDIATPYGIILFYRGNWCPHCLRHLAEYEAMTDELAQLGASIYAISTDPLAEAQQTVNRGLTYPVAYGLTREQAERIGAWWLDGRGGYVQTAEFLVERNGVIFGSLYASGGNFGISPEQAVFMLLRRARH
jgi:peroxiredoxin